MIAIEKEIIRDENGAPLSVVIPWSQYQEIADELGLPKEKEDLLWSPEKMGAEAQKFVDETDPVKADALWESITKGFYGK